MNWHPMSEPPTEAGEYLVWRRNQPDLDMPKIEFANFHPRSIYGWMHNYKYSTQEWMEETFSDWARVTAPGEEREVKEYTALAVMNDDQFVELCDDDYRLSAHFYNAALLPISSPGVARACALRNGGRVVRIRATVEEV